MNELDDQIDLRPYIATLLKYKWWIILVALAFALIAFVYSINQPHQYAAEATLLLTRSRPVLSLADQFPTVTEPIDSRSRMDALLTIAKSDAVIQQIIQDLDASLPDKYQSITDLKNQLDIENQGDSVSVIAKVNSPQLAADIANSWAAQIVQTINVAYSGEQPLEKIQEQLISAKAEYETAQQALETFLQKNPKSSLEQKYNEAKTLLEKLGYANIDQIDWLIQRKLSMEELTFQAEGLKKQIEDGSNSSAGNIGDALAVLLARMKALGIQNQPQRSGVGSVPNQNTSQAADVILNLQFDENSIQNDPNRDYGKDLDVLIQLSEEEKIKAEGAINLLITQVLQEDGEPYSNQAQAVARLQDLETQLERARSQEEQLTSNRDLAREAYEALAQKETEIKNAALTSNQINFSSPAIAPLEPEARGTITRTAIAGLLGATLSVVAIFVLSWWKSSNQIAETTPEKPDSTLEG